MPPFIKWTRPRGSVHNVQAALAGAETGCNILILSDASLYVLQNLVALDITFKSRWADNAQDHGYTPISDSSANYGAWVDLVEQIQGEVIDMSCEIVPVLEAMRDQMIQTNVVLAEIKTAIEAGTTAGQDALENIDDIEEIMDAINVILGGAAILAAA